MRSHACRSRGYFVSAGVTGGMLAILFVAGCSKEKPKDTVLTEAIVTQQPPASDHAGIMMTTETAAAPGLQPSARRGIGSAGASASNAGGAEQQTGAPSAVQIPDVLPGAMLVRTGQASLQVDSLETGIARVRDMARRTGAVVANTAMRGGHDQVRSASIELRIPSAHFDDAVNGLAPIGKLESVNVSVEDVGEEFVDVQARMDNARRLEQRLVRLLATRTGKLNDVLQVERELARVREEIERYEGRLRYLRTRASVSTLTVNVHEPPPLVATRPGEHPIREAFIQAWRNFVALSAGVIASLGVVVPIGIVALGIFVIARRIGPLRSSS
ncbi:MAG TPA: DUF4349 domain-containing protein [Gemmatimonadaceae bacterium]|nr:DUF4349 domain-containing protein [Gemmatimonadaceae bacterium]